MYALVKLFSDVYRLCVHMLYIYIHVSTCELQSNSHVYIVHIAYTICEFQSNSCVDVVYMSYNLLDLSSKCDMHVYVNICAILYD